jgi:hypothetical protein
MEPMRAANPTEIDMGGMMGDRCAAPSRTSSMESLEMNKAKDSPGFTPPSAAWCETLQNS